MSTPVPVYIAIANAPSNVDEEAIFEFIEAHGSDFETYTLAPPTPGHSRKAAFNYVALLEVAGSAVSIAQALWMAYERLIRPKITRPKDGTHIYVAIRKPDGSNAEYRIDNLQGDKDVFIHDFTATISELQQARGERNATAETVDEIKYSGMWIRRKQKEI